MRAILSHAQLTIAALSVARGRPSAVQAGATALTTMKAGAAQDLSAGEGWLLKKNS